MSKTFILWHTCKWWRKYGQRSRSLLSIISSPLNNGVELHLRSHYVLVTWDYIECNNEFLIVILVSLVAMFQVWRVHPKQMWLVGWRTTSGLIVKWCQKLLGCISQIITHDKNRVSNLSSSIWTGLGSLASSSGIRSESEVGVGREYHDADSSNSTSRLTLTCFF